MNTIKAFMHKYDIDSFEVVCVAIGCVLLLASVVDFYIQLFLSHL